MKNLLQLFILFAVANVQSDVVFRQRVPYIEMISTNAIPQICVTAREELPPCGIDKFRQNQREYESKINKIRQSYVDMIIDYKNTKNGSVENYGPGKIYLESFESLGRQTERKKVQKNWSIVNSSKIEERQLNLTKVNLSEIEEGRANVTKVNSPSTKVQEKQDTIEASDFNRKDLTESSIIHIVGVVRSMEKIIIVASECIPLGVEFCEDFPRPTIFGENKFKTMQKRSPRSIPEYLKYLWNFELKENSSQEPRNVTDDLVEIYPVNREDFFNRVDKRSISDGFNDVENVDRNYKLMDLLSGVKMKNLELYDRIEDF